MLQSASRISSQSYFLPTTHLLNQSFYLSTINSFIRASVQHSPQYDKDFGSQRKLLRKCVTCRKQGGKPYTIPDPPPLPTWRLEDSPPFTVTGVDFTGPLYVNTVSIENKVYVCLFTCANTRAIHLEVVEDLREGTFLKAFRRFVSR